MKKSSNQSGYAICLKNKGYEASLELRKLYRVIPDAASERRGLVRIVDESGEDYLYPDGFFAPVELPHAVEKALLTA